MEAETPSDRFAALAFDFDGVVVDSPSTHLAAWRTAFSEVGLDVDGIEILRREGGKDRDIAREIFSAYNHAAVDATVVESVCQRKRQIFDSSFQPRIVTGIDDFIWRLVDSGYLLCVVSGTGASVVHRLLKELALDEAFSAIITGDKLSRAKPDPEGYRRAVQELKVEAGRCLAIENSPPGIRAALQAGLACVALRSSLPSALLSEADAIFGGPAELAAWFFGATV